MNRLILGTTRPCVFHSSEQYKPVHPTILFASYNLNLKKLAESEATVQLRAGQKDVNNEQASGSKGHEKTHAKIATWNNFCSGQNLEILIASHLHVTRGKQHPTHITGSS